MCGIDGISRCSDLGQLVQDPDDLVIMGKKMNTVNTFCSSRLRYGQMTKPKGSRDLFNSAVVCGKAFKVQH
jgi:hypothetical protein